MSPGPTRPGLKPSSPSRAQAQLSILGSSPALRAGLGRVSGGMSGELVPQRTAFFTSAAIFASSLAVSAFSAKEVGHMAPSSRFAVSLNPTVA